MNKIVEWFFLAFKSVDNIFSLMLFRLGIINEMIIRTKTLGDFKVKNGLVETPILHLKLHIGAKNFPGFFKSNITLLKSVFFVYT